MTIKLPDEFTKVFTLAIGVGLSSLLSLGFVGYSGRILGASQSADLFTFIYIIYALTTLFTPMSTASARFSSIAFAREETYRISLITSWLKQKLYYAYVLLFVPALLIFFILKPANQGGLLFPLSITIATSLLVNIVNINRGAIRAQQMYSTQAINQSLEAFIRLGLGLLLVTTLMSVSSSLFAFLIASFISLILTQHVISPKYKTKEHHLTSEDKHSIYIFMLPILAVAVTNMGYQNAAIPLTRLFFSASDTSYFSAAATVARIIYAFSLPLILFILPYIIHRQYLGKDISKSVPRIISIFLLISIPFLGALWFWPDHIINLIYGPEFIEASPMLFLLGLAAFLNALAFIIIHILIALNETSVLILYVCSYLLELVVIFLFHSSPIELINSMLVIRGLFLLFITIFYQRKIA